MRIAAAVALGEIGKSGQLPVLDDAVRYPQPAHVGVLGGRHIKQSVVAPAEVVGRLRRSIARGLLLEPAVSVERMLLALELLLVVELAACRDGAVLRRDMLGIGPGWNLGFAAAEPAAGARDLQPRREAFEVALLLR